MKDEDGKTTSVTWKFTPSLATSGHCAQYVINPWLQQSNYGIVQMSMPAFAVVPVSPTVDGHRHAYAALELQAKQAQLAAAALRAQGNLEARESSTTSQIRRHEPNAVVTPQTTMSDVDEYQTTVILRNIPLEYTRQMFLDMLEEAGFAGKYNFVYMPRDFQRSFGLGYVFVNMTTSESAMEIQSAFNGFCDWAIPSQKICAVGWSNRHQGLDEQIKRYRNSPIMHDAVPDEYKPVLFQHGRRVAFPPPTTVLRLPHGLDTSAAMVVP